MIRDIRTRYLSDAQAERLYRLHPHLGKSPETYCPTCETRGWYRWRGQKVECDCEYQLQLHKWYLVSGVGVTYQRLDWDDYTGPTDILDNVQMFLQFHERFLNRGVGLFLSGDHGTGKTMIANLVLKELVKFGYSCWATTLHQTVQMFTAGWSDRDEQAYFERQFVNSEVLLLDDLGKELTGTRTKLAETIFDSILRQRVQNGRSTIITTNLASDKIITGYGSGTLSLINEKSLSIFFSGNDFRPAASSREIAEIKKNEVRPIV